VFLPLEWFSRPVAVVVHGAAQRPVTLDLALDDGVEEYRVEWLGEDVVAAQPHGIDLQGDVGFPGEVDDRGAEKLVVLTNDACDFDPGAIRHVHVHQDQVRVELSQHGHCLARIVDDFGNDLVFFEGAADQVAGGFGVLDDEYAKRFLLVPFAQFHDVFDDGV
jgi:hypothetical protein